MQGESRAERIAREILESDRYANTRAFEDRIYRDEPILRAGARAFERARGPRQHEGAGTQNARPRPTGHKEPRQRAGVGTHQPPLRPMVQEPVPKAYKKMRALAHKRPRAGYGYGYDYGSSGAKLFYEQGKLMEDFEDDFEGSTYFDRYYPSYEDMSIYQLRCYFTWRTRVRKGQTPEAPVSFLFVLAYELLCGIGVNPGKDGCDKLRELARSYAGASPSFDTYMGRWIHDYIIFHGLDSWQMASAAESSPYAAVGVLRKAESALLSRGQKVAWPQEFVYSLPEETELLDALCMLSRYRAERSRFVKSNKDDVAQVTARVFARMVDHCNKRRKVGFVDGLFGVPTRASYSMFPSAIFWAPTLHEDVRFELCEHEVYTCERGFWWRELPCRRADTSKEIGALLHAIDTRMRIAVGDPHPLKARSLPKYQAKFVDEEIASHFARKEAEEAARIHIDRSSLVGIRSAAVRTQEALLTDEEREDDATSDVAVGVAEEPVVPAVAQEQVAETGQAQQIPHSDLLLALLNHTDLPQTDELYLTLAVDAINEVFLDIVGDTVVEFSGNTPVLVEDYIDDVREALAV